MPSKFSWFFHGFPQFGHVHSPAHLISLLIYSMNKILKPNIFRTELLMPSSLSKPGLLISQVPHLSKWDLCPSSCPNPKPWSHLQLLLFLISFYQFVSSVIGSAFKFSSVQLLSHVWLCNPMNHSTPSLSVHHQLLEFTQTHRHWDGDAIQSSHLLSSPSPPALNLSQHQCLFKWVSSSHQVAKVLEFQFQHQSFQWTPRTNLR